MDNIDLGNGFSMRFTAWKPDRELNPQYEGIPDYERAGAIIVCPHSQGSILFDRPGFDKVFPNRPKWTVEQEDPLTLSPSIAASCGCHGFIREGKWENA